MSNWIAAEFHKFEKWIRGETDEVKGRLERLEAEVFGKPADKPPAPEKK